MVILEDFCKILSFEILRSLKVPLNWQSMCQRPSLTPDKRTVLCFDCKTHPDMSQSRRGQDSCKFMEILCVAQLHQSWQGIFVKHFSWNLPREGERRGEESRPPKKRKWKEMWGNLIWNNTIHGWLTHSPIHYPSWDGEPHQLPVGTEVLNLNKLSSGPWTILS